MGDGVHTDEHGAASVDAHDVSGGIVPFQLLNLMVFGGIAVGGPLLPLVLARRAWSTVEPVRFAALFWAATIVVSFGLAAIGVLGVAIGAFLVAVSLEQREPDLLPVAAIGTIALYWTGGLLHSTVAAWRSAERRRCDAGLEPFRLAPRGNRIAAGAMWAALVAGTTTAFVVFDVVLVKLGVDYGFRGVLEATDRPVEPDLRRGLVPLVPAVVMPLVHLGLGTIQVRALLRDRAAGDRHTDPESAVLDTTGPEPTGPDTTGAEARTPVTATTQTRPTVPTGA